MTTDAALLERAGYGGMVVEETKDDPFTVLALAAQATTSLHLWPPPALHPSSTRKPTTQGTGARSFECSRSGTARPQKLQGAGMFGSVLSGMPTAVWVVVGVLVVGYLMVSRLQGRPLTWRRLLVLPAVLTGIGLVELAQHAGQIRGLGVALLVAGCVVSFVFGIIRGATVALYRQDGYLWQRYRPVTLLWWLVLIAIKVVMDVGAHLVHAPLAGSSQAIMLTLGITLLGGAVAIAPRALASGVPLASRGSELPQGSHAGEDETWQAPSWRKSIGTLRDKANGGFL